MGLTKVAFLWLSEHSCLVSGAVLADSVVLKAPITPNPGQLAVIVKR